MDQRPLGARGWLAPVLAFALCLGLFGIVSPTAKAYEGYGSVGVTLGTGIILVPESTRPCCAPSLGLSGSLGLSDVFTARAFLGWAPHLGTETLHVGWFGAELLYTLDVARLVPFFGLGLDVVGTLFQGRGGMEFGAHAILGVDYLLSRDWVVGLDIRPTVLFLSAIETGRLDPAYFSAVVRLSYRFEI